MKIAVDARTVYQEPVLRGIGKTLITLYQTLARVRPDWTFLMYYQVWNGSNHFEGVPNVVRAHVDGKGDRFNAWQHFWLPGSAWLAGVDVLHCHRSIAPRFPLNPLVTTIHDLIPLEYRPNDPDVKEWVANVARGARRAQHVLTGSEYARYEVHRVLGVPLAKMTTVYWGPNEQCRKVADLTRVNAARTRYGLKPDQPYVLHFGQIDPRKNTRRLLEAWAQLPVELRSTYNLLVVGIESQALESFRGLARELGIDAGCLLHDYVPEEDVPVLLSGATVLAYLSLAEGFGLPVLDAFACETAVLASNTTSVPEVAGDATFLVDPRNTEAIRDGLRRLLDDEPFRAELVDRGLQRLKLFSWTRCAEQVADVLAACAR